MTPLPIFSDPADAPPPTLSKTRYMAGRQCDLRLWLEVHEPRAAEGADSTVASVRALGEMVGEIARRRWPNGQLVALDPSDPSKAVQHTRRLMRDPAVRTIFEATLIANGTQASADILERQADGSWHMVEVKASAEVKTEYKQDLAMQVRVFRAAGVRLSGARLLQPNKAYVRGDGESVDPQGYLTDTDLTAVVEEMQADTEDALAVQRTQVLAPEAPERAMGRHCDKPHPCPFKARCTQVQEANRGTVRYPVGSLSRASGKLLDALDAAGVRDIRHIPDAFAGLTPMQQRQREVVRSGVPYHDAAGFEAALEGVRFPVHFLDFETVAPVVPLYPGTRPHEVIPFQFSNHTLGTNGVPYHQEFLHATDDDPRERFLKKLISAVKPPGSIIVYSPYEKTQLKALARSMPQYATVIEEIIGRLVDLRPVVEQHLYYPGYAGSFSIKKVLPVHAPELSYAGLAIRKGDEAGAAFFEMVDRATTWSRKIELANDMIKYCRTDTEAMLQLFVKLAPGLIERRLSPRVAKRTRTPAPASRGVQP